MLVLTRKCMERVILNPGTPYEVIIMPIEIRGDKIRLGFEASPSIVIHREEVVDAINRQEQGK